MKTLREKPKMSGVILIEAIALILVIFIVSASIETVSNGRSAHKPLKERESVTNQLGRDFHAPVDAIHTYASLR